MKKFNTNKTFKQALLGGMSFVAFTALVSGTALATEVVSGTPITATDAGGLTENDETGTVDLTIDSNLGAVTLGADSTFAVDLTESGGQTDLVISVTTSGTANGVTFADDIDAGGNANDTIVINITNDNATFQGNISSSVGTTAADINVGSSSADPTLTMTIDNANNENLAIEATIDAVDAGDNVTLAIQTTNDGDTITFSNAIGSSVALDSITLATDTTATFNGSVAATTITNSSTNTTTFADNVTGDISIAAAGTTAITGADKGITGAVTTTADGQGTLTFSGNHTGDVTLVSKAVGTAGGDALLALNVQTDTDGVSTFGSTVDARTVTITGTGEVTFSGNVIAATKFDVQTAATVNASGDITSADVDLGADGTISLAANKKIVGAVDVTGGDGQGTLTFAATSTDTTLVSGNIGASNSLKILNVAPASGVTSTFGGTVDSNTINVTGAGTVQFDENVTANTKIDITGDGTVSIADNKKIIGNVDSGTANTGTLTIGATGGAIDVVDGTIGATNALKEVSVNTTGGVASFTGTVNTQTMTVSGTGGVTFDDTLDAATVSSTDTGTMTLTGAATVTGNLSHGGAVTTVGKLDVGGTTNVTGVLTVGAGNADFAGDVTASSIAAGANTLVFDGGTTAQTITGAISAAGTVTVTNSAGATFKNAVTATNVGVAASQSAIFEGAVNATAVTVGGTVTFENEGHTITTITPASGSTITLGSGVAASETVITGTLDDSAGSITVNMPSNFTTGTVVLSTIGAVDGDEGNFSLTSTALTSYAIDDNGTAWEITATSKSTASTASELGVSLQEATALNNANTAIATGDSAALTALTTALNTGGAEATKAAEQVSVQADTLGAASAASIGAGAQVVGVASNRLASLRTGGQYAGAQQTGFASGDAGMAKAAWVKPFGNWIKQDDKKGVKGYDADTFGIAAGLDAEVTDGIRLGGSFAYSNTDVDGKGSGNAKTDIDSYQLTVYGDYTTDKYYVEGMVGYARNNNETSRQLTFGGLNRTAEGDYDSNQYMVSVGGGMPINLKGNAFVTPMGSLSYTHVSSDSYTETGAGNLNLNVNPDDVDAFVASLGAKVHTKIKQGKGHLIPSAQLGVSYDFSGDEATATGSYTGGGAAFTVEGAEVEQLAGNVGVGLIYDDGAWSVAGNYDAELKSGYTGHSAMLEARFKF